MLRSIALAALALLAWSTGARAGACPADVAVSGEARLVAPIEALLDERGIRTGAGEQAGCDVVRARVERRDASYLVAIDLASGEALERRVGDLATAATVIESFVRHELSSPLLARRAPPVAAAPAEPAAPPTRARARGVHLFAAAETSVASDHTNWLGGQVGACMMLGPVCAAARLRAAHLLGGESEVWDRARRGSKELLLGIDVPLAVGRTVLSPGFGIGLAATHTENQDESEEAITGGLRADVHVGLAIPVKGRLAIDLSTSLDFTQETYAESETVLPDEPMAFLRFGAGIRYGGL